MPVKIAFTSGIMVHIIWLFSTQKIKIKKIVNLVSQIEIYNVKYVIELILTPCKWLAYFNSGPASWCYKISEMKITCAQWMWLQY